LQKFHFLISRLFSLVRYFWILLRTADLHMITRKYALLLLLLLQTVESNSKATKRWERVEFLRYQDFVCRIEGGRISSFDHDAPEPASSPEATFRDSEGNLVSPEEDEDGEDDLPIELELPDNPTVTNIPLQHHYDNLLLSGFLPSPSPIPPFPSSSPIPPSSLSKNCVLPGSLLCPVVSSRKTTALLSSLHASSWRAVRGVENTLASKVPLSEDASLLKGERCLEDGDDWVEFLSSVCLSRRGATLSVHRVPSSVKSGEEVRRRAGAKRQQWHREPPTRRFAPHPPPPHPPVSPSPWL